MSRGCRSVCRRSAEGERANWDTCLNGKTGRLTKKGTLKALCSVKQRGDMGKESRDKQLEWNASQSCCTHSSCLYRSQAISDQMRLIDFGGEFIVAPFSYKSAQRANVMCNKVCCGVLNHLKMLQSPKSERDFGRNSAALFLFFCRISSFSPGQIETISNFSLFCRFFHCWTSLLLSCYDPSLLLLKETNIDVCVAVWGLVTVLVLIMRHSHLEKRGCPFAPMVSAF